MSAWTFDRGQLTLLRAKHRWSLRKTAKAAGLSVATVHKAESGRVKNPNLETVGALASAFGVPPQALMTANGHGPKRR